MPMSKKRVLLVEDERHIRVLVGSILRRKGYETVEAENGLEALRLLQEESDFNLIITDLQMPELGGVGLLREMQRYHLTIPVVVISAYTATDWAKEAVGQAIVTLPKPFSHAQLVSVIDGLMS